MVGAAALYSGAGEGEEQHAQRKVRGFTRRRWAQRRAGRTKKRVMAPSENKTLACASGHQEVVTPGPEEGGKHTVMLCWLAIGNLAHGGNAKPLSETATAAPATTSSSSKPTVSSASSIATASGRRRGSEHHTASGDPDSSPQSVDVRALRVSSSTWTLIAPSQSILSTSSAMAAGAGSFAVPELADEQTQGEHQLLGSHREQALLAMLGTQRTACCSTRDTSVYYGQGK